MLISIGTYIGVGTGLDLFFTNDKMIDLMVIGICKIKHRIGNDEVGVAREERAC